MGGTLEKQRPSSRALSLVFAIIAFSSSAAAALLSSQSPAPGYELSWLNALPWSAKAALLVSFVATATLVVRREYLLAAAAAAIFTLSVGLVPFARGYASQGRGDPQSYAGFVLQISTTGHVWAEDIYPLVHILLSSLSILLGVELPGALAIWAIAQFVIWLATVWYGMGGFTRDRKMRALAVLIATVPVFTQYHFLLFPNGYALWLFALFLALWVRRGDARTAALAILLVIALPYAHPAVGALAIVLTTLLVLVEGAVVKVRPVGQARWTNMGLPLVGSVVFLLWYLDFRQFQVIILRAFGEIATRSDSQLAEAADSLARARPPVIDVALAAFVLVGAVAIFGGIFLWAITREIWTRRAMGSRELFFLVSFGVMAGASLSMLLVPFLGHGVFYLRILNLPYPMLLIPWALPLLIPRRRLPVLAVGIVVALLAANAGIYRSPIVFQPNDQVAAEEFAVGRWLHDHAPHDKLIRRVNTEPWRLVVGTSGPEHQEHHGKTFSKPKFFKGGVAPEHFGSGRLADAFGPDQLMTLTVFDEVVYTTVWSSSDRWNEEDFHRVMNEATNSIVYTAGESHVLKS